MLSLARLARLGAPLALASAAGNCGSDAGPTLPQGMGVRLTEVATGLSVPLYLDAPPGDPSRLFIVEKTGTIRIVKDGALVPTPFLNLSDQVSGGYEQGLLGLAFDPDYAATGQFVVHYTDPAGDTRLSLFEVSGDPDVANGATEQVLLSVDQPHSNHNGGQVAFGPDGLLYLGLGDGGGSGDPDGRGQDLSDLLGSILRIDVRSATPYAVPPENPFLGVPGASSEVWSYGLRNPWRFSFDRATGDLYIADVGETRYEEINVAPASEGGGRGKNYGWSLMEGAHCFRSSGCDQSGLVLPTLEYGHDQGCTVIGGYVYRGGAIPSLQGHYLFGDLCGRWVRSFRLSGGAAAELTEWPALRAPAGITSFGQDAAGELYILTEDGSVLKIVPDP